MKNTSMSHAEDKLEDALALLDAGVSVAEILADAGDDAEWLRPSLEMAMAVGELQTAITVPSPEASLQRMLAYGQELAATTPPAVLPRSSWSAMLANFFGSAWLPRLATGLVSALLMFVVLGGTLAVLAQRSLPGQALYSLKRAGETVRLSLTFDPGQRAQLIENFNQYRQVEARLLLEQNMAAAVNFFGQIESVTNTSLRLDGLAIQLTPQTRVSGKLAVGARVEVEVLTQPPDRLIALAVAVIEPARLTPTPPPTPTSTLMPTPLPTATRSLSSATDTLQLPTATSLPPTVTPILLPPPPTAAPLLPTATPPASPLIPPAGDTENDNTNENGNEGTGSNEDNNTNEDGQANENSTDAGPDDSGNGNSGSGGGAEDHSGSGGGDDNSGSGGGGNSGSDSSGSDGGGGGTND